MPSVHRIKPLTALIADPAFVALAEDALRDYLDWDELTKRPLPAGLGPEETWALLTAVRRLGATTFPIRDVGGHVFWYTRTREASLCIEAIERHCHADSAAHRSTLHRHGRQFLVGSRIREAIAACQVDGVVISTEDAKTLLKSKRVSRNAADQLLLNSHDLLYELDELIGEPFSPELLAHLYDHLIADVDVSALERRPVRHGLADRVEVGGVSPEARAEVIRQFCAYANGRTGDPAEPVVMKAYSLLNATQYWSLFPDFNGIVGRCIFRLFATQQDYPVLGYLPITSLYQAWSEGRMQSSIVRFSHSEIESLGGEAEHDYTPEALTYLQITVAALDELLRAMYRTRRRDAEVRSTLENDVEINYRQRSIIAHALANPGVEFRIREHQTLHDVVYATARADLLDLVALGYLRQEQRGKAFVFLPEPGLAQRLGRASEA